MFESLFNEFAVVLIAAAVVAAFAVRLRQPLIIAFIAVGVLAGPAGLGWITATDEMQLLASLGIAVLLFVVGLKLDVDVIRSMGPVALSTGLGQVAFTSIFGFIICQLLGLGVVASVYVAVALTFSSTIIIVKLLSDKREIDALHGRIAVGFLIVQDLVVILAMIVLTAFGGSGSGDEGEGASTGAAIVSALLTLLRGVGLLVGLALVTRYVLPRLMPLVARSQELLMLFAIAWAVSLAALGDTLGLSKEVGAFLAGVSLASTPFRDSIGARLVSVRDFLLLFFFLTLGASLDLSQVGEKIVPALVLSAFVLIGNPLIVMVIMGAMGYRRRTGFLAGLTVAQISEFSLILGALGVTLGHITGETMALITLVGLITIGLSTYMILYSHPLYERLAPLLRIFERRNAHRESDEDAPEEPGIDVVLFGLGRYGSNIAEGLRARGATVLGVDFDPRAVAHWKSRDYDARYGDAEDPELPATLPLSRARWVVSTMPQHKLNTLLREGVREAGFKGRIALTAHTLADAEALTKEGADVVLLPFTDAATRAVEMLTADESRDDATTSEDI
ncbi:MAG: sodium:proton exchanger [Phycisphaerales bacterium]|nr:MAG: sodium:proton exchanger [Phycisphaerales bacterium]